MGLCWVHLLDLGELVRIVEAACENVLGVVI
jgi:hypothetical protein